MTDEQRKECHEHAWRHLTIHTRQRMMSLQFFIALCTVIIGGIVVSLKEGGNSKAVAPLAFSLPFFAFVFFKLDERNRQFIKCAEEALKYLENHGLGLEDVDGKPHVLKIFSAEAFTTRELKKKKLFGYIPVQFTYATCFRLIFILFGTAGVGVGVFLFMR